MGFERLQVGDQSPFCDLVSHSLSTAFSNYDLCTLLQMLPSSSTCIAYEVASFLFVSDLIQISILFLCVFTFIHIQVKNGKLKCNAPFQLYWFPWGRHLSGNFHPMGNVDKIQYKVIKETFSRHLCGQYFF